MRLRLEKRFQEWILISFVLQQVYANITIIVVGITFEIRSSKFLLYVLFVMEKRRYLGLFVVNTDAVKNAIFNVNICTWMLL